MKIIGLFLSLLMCFCIAHAKIIYIHSNHLARHDSGKPNILFRAWHESRAWMVRFEGKNLSIKKENIVTTQSSDNWVRQRIQALRQEQQRDKHYFIMGAIVAIVGVLLGCFVGIRRRRKKL